MGDLERLYKSVVEKELLKSKNESNDIEILNDNVELEN